MPMPGDASPSDPFHPDRYYTNANVDEVTGLSPRGRDVWLAREGVTRHKLLGRTVRYRGAELNAALKRAAERGGLKAAPTGAAARRIERRRARTRPLDDPSAIDPGASESAQPALRKGA